MKTTFDLPEPLLRRAKAAAANQGRPLRDLVAEAIAEKLDPRASAAPQRRAEPPSEEWDAYLATLVRQPDGSYINPNGTDEDVFFRALDEIRNERLSGQVAMFPPAAPSRVQPRKRA